MEENNNTPENQKMSKTKKVDMITFLVVLVLLGAGLIVQVATGNQQIGFLFLFSALAIYGLMAIIRRRVYLGWRVGEGIPAIVLGVVLLGLSGYRLVTLIMEMMNASGQGQ